ncbi:phage tail protein [Tumebacillus lipolyticus]|uniref:Phage tail protein n=1 Tax=Tumebacillus lipolyticus TaxID=1280370 RepID=A0ABW4ZXK7_9BACL
MADAYIGEIRIFAGNFAPKGWALCNGQLLPIQQNPALYSILGVQYGGDGKTTFALPNLMGNAAMNQGAGQGLTPRTTMGQQVGASTVTLLSTQIPAHTHIPQAIVGDGSTGDPQGNIWAQLPDDPFNPPPNLYDPTPNVPMSPLALNVAGGTQAHNNMQPFIAQNFIICLQGEFPSRG